MPTYTFHCNACDQPFEQILPLGSVTTPPCPSCGGATRKIIRPPMVHFRGSGFYKTDSSNSSAPAATPAKSAVAKPAEVKPSSTPAPSTPAASSPAKP